MSVEKYPLVVLITLVVSATSSWGGEEGASARSQKWGLWSDPQVEMVQPVEKVTPPPVEHADEPGDKDYLLGPGDQLDISVWKDEALTRSLAVLPDGKISFPLVGELTAAGKTVAQLKQEIGEKLSRFVPDPILSLEVRQVNSQIIYVIGRVNNPGRFVLNVNVNVLQALAMAGGCNPFASKNKIKILRNEGDQTKVFTFKYDDVVDKDRLEENIGLKRGDVVVVP